MLHVERKLQCTNRPEACNSIHLYWIGFTSDEAYMHCWLILRLNLSPGISGTYSLINNQYIRTAVCIWLFISFKGVGTQFLLVVWVQVTYQFHLYMCTLHLIATRVIEQNANMQTRVIEQNANMHSPFLVIQESLLYSNGKFLVRHPSNTRAAREGVYIHMQMAIHMNSAVFTILDSKQVTTSSPNRLSTGKYTSNRQIHNFHLSTTSFHLSLTVLRASSSHARRTQQGVLLRTIRVCLWLSNKG
jgi:hypothetical protein